MSNIINTPNESDFLFYQGNGGTIKVQIILGDETVWVTQSSMADIFGTTKQNISEHIINIYNSSELEEAATVRKILTVQIEGDREVKREVNFYNLDVIISVGYRVNSYKATKFRVWATSVLKEYMIKGFALDDERLKQGKELFGKDYFSELLERIREIRASERRFYQKITDIYAQCSIDYDPQSPITNEFYAIVQNKIHYAITHHTAAEIINERVDSKKDNMGLTTWKNAPEGKILKGDISIAKNYLNKKELSEMNSFVNLYLDFAEMQALRQKKMKMSDWILKLDDVLKLNEYDILKNAGKIKKKIADQKAEKEFEKFRINQDVEYWSDFDKFRAILDKLREDYEKKEQPTEFDKLIDKALIFNPKGK